MRWLNKPPLGADMERIWADLHSGLIVKTNCKQQMIYKGYQVITSVEMGCVKIKDKYYRVGQPYPLEAVPLVELHLITDKELDDFDTQVQCEEYYNDDLAL